MLECRLIVLTTWPGVPTTERRAGQFRSGYIGILNDLVSELDKLNASDVALALAVPESNLRKCRRAYDGWPKADTRTNSPGIVLSFEAGQMGRMQYACDTYLSWWDNLRAISLTLTALRAVDRYGASTGGQQYTGFKALPPPVKETAYMPTSIEESAAAYLATFTEGADTAFAMLLYQDAKAFKSYYRDLSARLHPDRGGDTQVFATINAAADVLKKYHEEREG